MKKIQLLLTRMGFALIDYQQKFQYMSIEVKRKMKDEFDHRFLPEYGLIDFYYRRFLRLHGYSSISDNMNLLKTRVILTILEAPF